MSLFLLPPSSEGTSPLLEDATHHPRAVEGSWPMSYHFQRLMHKKMPWAAFKVISPHAGAAAHPGGWWEGPGGACGCAEATSHPARAHLEPLLRTLQWALSRPELIISPASVCATEIGKYYRSGFLSKELAVKYLPGRRWLRP